MSNDVSYVLRVVDEFSGNLKKFKIELKSTTESIESANGQFSKLGLISTKTFKDAQGKIITVNQTFRDFHGNLNTISQKFDQVNSKSKFFTQNLIDLGKASGIYFGARETLDFSGSLIKTRREMDSMEATLKAVLPQFDQTKPAVQLASEEIEYLKNTTNRLGVSFEAAREEYTKFLAATAGRMPLASARRQFEAFAGISRLYGISPARFQLVMNAITQMTSKEIVSMEELKRQLGDSLPGALKLFADASGKSLPEFIKLVEAGRVGAGILKNVADKILIEKSKQIADSADTTDAKINRLSNSWFFFKNTLSGAVAPALSNTVTGLTFAVQSLDEFFGSLNDEGKIAKLDDKMFALAKTLQIAGEGMSALVSGSKDLWKVLAGFGNLGVDAVSTAYLGLHQLYGVGEMAAGVVMPWKMDELVNSGQSKIKEGAQGFQEIIKMNQQRYFSEPQKVDVNVTLNNAPKGTQVEVTKSSPAVKTGNVVNYDNGGYD